MEAHNAGLDGSHPVTLQAKALRLELLNVKADLGRELGRLRVAFESGPALARTYTCGSKGYLVNDAASVTMSPTLVVLRWRSSGLPSAVEE